MHYLMFLLICMFWATSFILMKRGFEVFGPLSIGAGRVISGAAALYVLWLILRRGSDDHTTGWPTRFKHLTVLLVPAMLGTTLPYVVQPYLIGTYQASAFFGMMICLVPIMTIAVSVPMLGVYPTLRELIGVLGGLSLMGVLFYEAIARGVPWSAFLLAMTVPLCYAINNTFVNRYLTEVASLAIAFWSLLIAGWVMLPMSMAREQIAISDLSTLGTAIGAIAILGILSTAWASIMFLSLIKARGPLFASMVTYVVAPGAVVWGQVDDEPTTWIQLVGLAGILAMVALVQWPSRSSTPARRDDKVVNV
jgi:drug/metabolite transporter (DMT)-like permease